MPQRILGHDRCGGESVGSRTKREVWRWWPTEQGGRANAQDDLRGPGKLSSHTQQATRGS